MKKIVSTLIITLLIVQMFAMTVSADIITDPSPLENAQDISSVLLPVGILILAVVVITILVLRKIKKSK